MRRSCLILLFVLLLAACKTDELPTTNKPVTTTGDEKLVVMRGTYFGMCGGLCLDTLTIDSIDVDVVRAPWGRFAGEPAPIRYDSTISVADWQSLRQSFDRAAFDALDSIIGCPDCADGGGEWIEVRQGDYQRKVLFENGQPVPSIQPFVDRLRAIRAQFPPK